MPQPFIQVGSFKIAPFKDSNKGPYGPFANTTNKYPVTQTVSVDGKDHTFEWPSSEHAFHAQKILHLKSKLPANDPKQAELTTVLNTIIKTKSKSNEEFHPDDYTNIVNTLIQRNPSLGANKQEFDKRCDADYHPTHKPNAGINPATNEPYTTTFMRTVLKLKLAQHPALNDIAEGCAREGIIPVEVSKRDESWASGREGFGANRLGILVLELGNEGLKKKGETPAITDPKSQYSQLRQQHDKSLAHGQLEPRQFEQTPPPVGTVKSTALSATTMTPVTTVIAPKVTTNPKPFAAIQSTGHDLASPAAKSSSSAPVSSMPPKQTHQAHIAPPISVFKGHDQTDKPIPLTVDELKNRIFNDNELPKKLLDHYLINSSQNQVTAAKIVAEGSVKNVMQDLRVNAEISMVDNNRHGSQAANGQAHDESAMKVTFKTTAEAQKFVKELYEKHGIHSHTLGDGYMKTPQGRDRNLVFLTKDDLNIIAKNSKLSDTKEPGHLAYDAIESQYKSIKHAAAPVPAHVVESKKPGM